MFGPRYGRSTEVLAIIVLVGTPCWPQQQMSSLDRDRAQGILQVVANDVRKHYYDPKFHEVDWDAEVAQAKQRIAKADSFNLAMSDIAAALASLNDSHTFFIPPQHAYRFSYGFEYQIIGDHCFVTQVRPKSDAAVKGVKTGDELLTINGFNANRDDLWKMQYVFSILRPQTSLRLALQDAAGAQRQVDVTTKFGRGFVREEEDRDRWMRSRYAEFGDNLLALKVPLFLVPQSEVESMIGKARKYPNLIIDLRGNPGGSVETLKYFVGGMFDKEIKIADRVGRKETRPEIAKPIRNPFMGKLVVLVDARSASAAELFARIVQVEKRGVVLGDHSSGSVMEAQHYDEQMGADPVIFYGVSITEWDLAMADGNSLEHVGVTPDEIVLPSAKDLANDRDPALARAAEILGVKVSPEDAGRAFPYQWSPE